MIKRIVAAVDGSENAREALEAAIDLAKLTHASLTLVHVVGSGPVSPALARMARVEHLAEPHETGASGNVANVFGNLATASREADSTPAAHEIHKALGERLLTNAAAVAHNERVESVNAVMKEDSPAEGILDAAKDADADIIVIGSRGLSELKGLLLGSVSHKVLQLAPCNCLVVK